MTPTEPPKSPAGTGGGRAIAVVGLIAFVVLVSVLSNRSGGSSSPPAGAAVGGRCIPVPTAVLSAIATGLTMSGNGSIVGGQAVKSTAFKSVYFIAALISGPGMQADSIGLWASNDLQDDGPFFAIDRYAHNFTDWGQPKDISQFDDGAQEAKACAKGKP